MFLLLVTMGNKNHSEEYLVILWFNSGHLFFIIVFNTCWLIHKTEEINELPQTKVKFKIILIFEMFTLSE